MKICALSLIDIGALSWLIVLNLRFERPDFPQIFSGASSLVGA